MLKDNENFTAKNRALLSNHPKALELVSKKCLEMVENRVEYYKKDWERSVDSFKKT